MFGSQSAKRSVVLLRHKLWLLCKYVIAWWLILQHKYWKEHFFSWQGILHLGFLVIKTAFLSLQLWDVLLVDVAFVTRIVVFSGNINRIKWCLDTQAQERWVFQTLVWKEFFFFCCCWHLVISAIIRHWTHANIDNHFLSVQFRVGQNIWSGYIWCFQN